MNSTLAAGLIIDNYLAEDASYYIGSALNNDEVILKIITEYEVIVTNQHTVQKQIFFAITSHIKQQLLPYLKEFKKHEDQIEKMSGMVSQQHVKF